tara:strand:- start:304 stop:549 length:246 start_codon:yes stop_codon:yes gene_type:complete
MLSKVKSSRAILYLIFITIAILILTYYIFSDKSLPVKVGGNTVNTIIEAVTNTANAIVEEIDLDSIKNIIPETRFSKIIIK